MTVVLYGIFEYETSDFRPAKNDEKRDLKFLGQQGSNKPVFLVTICLLNQRE